MKNVKLKNLRKARRKNRNRAKIFGTAEKPRLSVFRSNRYTTAQLIDDATGKTLAFESTKTLSKSDKLNKTEQAKLLGEKLAEQAQKLGIKKAVFNKGTYLYHGRIRAVAEGARVKGLVL
ncbi:MAG: 50S ribosomal protein L18 [Candidatus Harrisonbacteria bacterium]|nr:50S ribosomal protein L18 [Candidatus Harrisonbacteria bacterium]